MKFYHLIGLSCLFGLLEFILLRLFELPYFIRFVFVLLQGMLFSIYLFLYFVYLIVRSVQRKKRKYRQKSLQKNPQECL